MFDTSLFTPTSTDAHGIVSDYRELLSDGEPLVYTGKNVYGSHILGSLLYRDINAREAFYLHVLVPSGRYLEYVYKKITYRDIIESVNDLYIIHQKHRDQTEQVYSVLLNMLPLGVLPTEQSYYPIDDIEYGPRFQFKFTGLQADEHKAIPSVVSDVVKNGEKLLELSANVISDYCDYTLHPYCVHSDAASYTVTFSFDIQKKRPDLFNTDITVREVISEILGYCINNLPYEYEAVLSGDSSACTKFHELRDRIKRSLMIKENIEQLEQKVRETTEKSAELISTIGLGVGNGYSTLTISNEGEYSNILGLFNEDTAKQYSDVAAQIDHILEPVTEDESYKSFKLLVYSLNVDSRKGKALVDKAEDPDSFWRSGFIVEGERELTNSPFSHSLDQVQKIEVNARARVKEKSGKITYLYIDY